jgi:hypothetical protein
MSPREKKPDREELNLGLSGDKQAQTEPERTLEVNCANCGAKFVAYYGYDQESVVTVEVKSRGLCWIGRVMSDSALILSPDNSEIAVFAPTCTPRIFDQPTVLSPRYRSPQSEQSGSKRARKVPKICRHGIAPSSHRLA